MHAFRCKRCISLYDLNVLMYKKNIVIYEIVPAFC